MKKIYAGFALALVAVVFVYAVASFLRENWAANQPPGRLEGLLAKWLLSFSRRSQAEVRNPLSPTEENLREGREHFEKQCAFCHGTDGKGQTSDGIQFYPAVPSLADRHDHSGQDEELTDGQVHFIVIHGIRYTAMPSFEKVLTTEQTWKVVLWVRRLPQQHSHGPSESPEAKPHGP